MHLLIGWCKIIGKIHFTRDLLLEPFLEKLVSPKEYGESNKIIPKGLKKAKRLLLCQQTVVARLENCKGLKRINTKFSSKVFYGLMASGNVIYRTSLDKYNIGHFRSINVLLHLRSFT